MFKALGDYFKKYFKFSGRTSRKDFWLAMLGIWIIELIISAVTSNYGVAGYQEVGGTVVPVYEAWAQFLISAFPVLTFFPTWTVSVRRLHDTGKSGWFLLWGILPLIGWIILLVRYLKKGNEGENKYGQ